MQRNLSKMALNRNVNESFASDNEISVRHTTTDAGFKNLHSKFAQMNEIANVGNKERSEYSELPKTFLQANSSDVLKSQNTQHQHSGLNTSSGEENNYETTPVLGMQIFGAIVCSSVFMSVAVVFGYTGVTLPSMMDPHSEDLILTKFDASIFSSIVNIGAIIGSIISSFVMVWIGQRTTLLIFLPFGMASWILLRFSVSLWLLLLGRVLQGFVIGVAVGSANNYISEIAHASVRGRLVSLSNLSYQAGFLFVYLIGSTTLSWRNVGLICGVPTMAIPFLGMLFLPHSPRWLAINGRMEEAEKALGCFRGPSFNITSEIKDITHQAAKTSQKSTVRSQLKILREKRTLSRFTVLAVLNFASHFTGNFAMATYSVTIFESANISINSYLSTILTALTRLLGVCIYFMFADKVGRKYIFIYPQVLAGLCTILVGLFFYLKLIMDEISTISWLPLTSLIFFTMFSCMSSPVLTVWRSELLPNSVRAMGVSLLFIVFYCSTFSASFSFSYMVDSVGPHWTFWIYGMNSLLMVLISAICIPETQGKTLEEIHS